MNARGVRQCRCISNALSPVIPLVHMSILRNTSRKVNVSDLDVNAENVENDTPYVVDSEDLPDRSSRSVVRYDSDDERLELGIRATDFGLTQLRLG